MGDFDFAREHFGNAARIFPYSHWLRQSEARYYFYALEKGNVTSVLAHPSLDAMAAAYPHEFDLIVHTLMYYAAEDNAPRVRELAVQLKKIDPTVQIKTVARNP